MNTGDHPNLLTRLIHSGRDRSQDRTENTARKGPDGPNRNACPGASGPWSLLSEGSRQSVRPSS